ncbi:nucleolar complex-associated protein [Ceratobasidium sp. AG-Ba]|nr:nucleolar complex-associated protein [Ceratobasidium sp. AG-Ba]
MKLKRSASAGNAKANKKRKVEQLQNGKKSAKAKGKERAFERPTISIPCAEDEEEEQALSEEDLEFFKENAAGQFLASLEKKGISRSKKETERLHKLNKPAREPKHIEDDLPSIHSHSDDGEDWSSDLNDASDALSDEDLEVSDPESVDSTPPPKRQRNKVDSDEELPYERAGRPRAPSPKRTAERLPIKLGDGRILSTGTRDVAPDSEEDEESEPEGEEEETGRGGVEDVSTGARFGRPAVRDVVQQKSRKARIEGAKEQLASICQEIMADPENSLGLLRRLHTFALPQIPGSISPQDGSQLPPTPNDPQIRRLALLSQLAVFKDIVPGYRIRSLTEHEKSEKVSQMVQRTRDWEQGLVGVYQNYLKLLEAEVKAKSELDQVALKCMCTLLTSITHFNFRLNIMATVVGRLSKRSWDESSDLCSSTLVTMLKNDRTGTPSLEAVRLLNRMIKERKFNIHPRVLNCLLHLRLKTELGVRANREKVDREEQGKERGKKLKKGKKANMKEGQVYLSKKAKKAAKANKEIEAEMAEAEAEVDKEERSQQQTETLKLLFVLYFRILKHPTPTPLLPAALEGIARYAHMVNVDFFKDLLDVLKELIQRGTFAEGEVGEDEVLRQRLLCISTAFELLSGQGEALNIDLNDFVQHLYNLIIPLSLSPNVEVSPSSDAKSNSVHLSSSSDLLFRALSKVFAPRTAATAHPIWRVAAFAKRLLTASLQFPPLLAVKALEFVVSLIKKHPQLDAMLETDERVGNGVYRPDVDDPQLANALGVGGGVWEVRVLRNHWDARVRDAAVKIEDFVRT